MHWYICIWFIVNLQFFSQMQRLNKISDEFATNDQFRYTTGSGCLTLQQRRFYEENGYIVVKGFLKDEDIQTWTTRFLEYCDRKLPPPLGMQVVKDASLIGKKVEKGEAWITKLQDFQFDDVLQSYCTNADLVPYLKSFCGENIKSVHTMFINKPPNMGENSRHPLHQDFAYFPFGPADRIVAAWASLQDASEVNGALQVVPGSHKGRFFAHQYPDWEGKQNKAYFGIEESEKYEGKTIFLEMKKGDIVFFHPLLIHGSGKNKSQGYRKSMCCHFAASECKYFPVQGKVQELVAKEIMSYAKKKLQVDNYHMIWKLKSKLVNGVEYEEAL